MGITPLTGVVTPFLSYGGSAMLANFAALGLLAAIHADRRPAERLRAVSRADEVSAGHARTLRAASSSASSLRVQVFGADDYVVKPHLGVQADGGRRFEYNPRVLDLIRQLPRGTIYDRTRTAARHRGRPRTRRARAGVRGPGRITRQRVSRLRPSDAIRSAARRFMCSATRGRGSNWSATNTSYVERDADARLRGFDDHASTGQDARPRGPADVRDPS